MSRTALTLSLALAAAIVSGSAIADEAGSEPQLIEPLISSTVDQFNVCVADPDFDITTLSADELVTSALEHF